MFVLSSLLGSWFGLLLLIFIFLLERNHLLRRCWPREAKTEKGKKYFSSRRRKKTHTATDGCSLWFLPVWPDGLLIRLGFYQCDQTGSLFAQCLAIYNDENLPNSIAKYKICKPLKNVKCFKNFALYGQAGFYLKTHVMPTWKFSKMMIIPFVVYLGRFKHMTARLWVSSNDHYTGGQCCTSFWRQILIFRCTP